MTNIDTEFFGDISRESLDKSDNIEYGDIAEVGLSEKVVRQISASFSEPEWMLEHRLKCLEAYQKMEMPKW